MRAWKAIPYSYKRQHATLQQEDYVRKSVRKIRIQVMNIDPTSVPIIAE
jgi:hypothetical protein